MESFIKLYRKFLDWEWYTDFNTKVLFLHCLLKANFKEKRWRGIIIPAGSFVTSVSSLSEETRLSRRSVRTSIERLKSTNEITTKTTNRFTMINLVNWANYQVSDNDDDKQNDKQVDKQATNKRQTNDKQTTTTKECKELKERKNKELKDKSIGLTPTHSFIKPTIQDIEKYCLERNNEVDAEQYHAYYESNGWRVGKNPMKDWKAAVRTWERRDQNGNGKISKKPDVKIDWLDSYVSKIKTS